MTIDDSIKLAKLWVALKAVKDKLDNEIIPVAGYLDAADAGLMIALEEASAKIQNHFERFRLVGETRK